MEVAYHFLYVAAVMDGTSTAPQDDVIEAWRGQAKARPLRILITGKVGVGKSALINNLLGGEMFKEGFSPDAETKSILVVDRQVHGITVQLFDTPGLAALSDDRSAISIFAEMSARAEFHASKRIDLFFYCKPIMERVTEEDQKILRALTFAFGQQVWEHGIIVLTKANNVHIKNKQHYSKTIEQYELRLKTVLSKLSVSCASDIPVLTAGYEECVIPCEADWEDNDWKKRLFTAAIRRADPVTVPALFEVRFKESITKLIHGLIEGNLKHLLIEVLYQFEIWWQKYGRVKMLHTVGETQF